MAGLLMSAAIGYTQCQSPLGKPLLIPQETQVARMAGFGGDRYSVSQHCELADFRISPVPSLVPKFPMLTANSYLLGALLLLLSFIETTCTAVTAAACTTARNP